MINTLIKKLQKQISELESKITTLEKNSFDEVNKLGYTVITKKLLNFNIITRKKF